MIYVVIGLLVAFAIFVCFALAVASFSFDNYYENLKKTNKMRNGCGVSTLDYVDEINDKYFDSKLNIMRCPEHQDHYSSGVVALSEKTMASNSLASLAIVSHELGHARQDSQGNKLVTHWKRKRTGRIVGLFFMPLVITGAVKRFKYSQSFARAFVFNFGSLFLRWCICYFCIFNFSQN